MAITSDNIHLSEPTPHADVAAPTTKSFADACTDPMVLHFIEAATAPNTRRAYDSDLKHFLAWGGCRRARMSSLATWQSTPRPLSWPPWPAAWSQSAALTPYKVCLTRSDQSSSG